MVKCEQTIMNDDTGVSEREVNGMKINEIRVLFRKAFNELLKAQLESLPQKQLSLKFIFKVFFD